MNVIATIDRIWVFLKQVKNLLPFTIKAIYPVSKNKIHQFQNFLFYISFVVSSTSAAMKNSFLFIVFVLAMLFAVAISDDGNNYSNYNFGSGSDDDNNDFDNNFYISNYGSGSGSLGSGSGSGSGFGSGSDDDNNDFDNKFDSNYGSGSGSWGSGSDSGSGSGSGSWGSGSGYWRRGKGSGSDYRKFYPVRNNHSFKKIEKLLNGLKWHLKNEFFEEKKQLRNAFKCFKRAKIARDISQRKLKEESHEFFRSKAVLQSAKFQFFKTKKHVKNELKLIYLLSKILRNSTYRGKGNDYYKNGNHWGKWNRNHRGDKYGHKHHQWKGKRYNNIKN